MNKLLTFLGVVVFALFLSACEPPSSESLSQTLQFDQRSFTLEVNQTEQIRTSLEGVNSAEIRYESDAPQIVSVSSTGLLRGLRPGIASIKITAGNLVDYANVMVLQPVLEPVIRACVTQEVIQSDDSEFILVCQDGTTIPTGFKSAILEAEVTADGELVLTYSNGDVVNIGNVVGPQGQRGQTGSSGGGVAGPPGSPGTAGESGQAGAVITTAKDQAELLALLSLDIIDRIVFTSGIVYDSGVTLLYQDTITMGDLYFNSGAYATPTFTMNGVGTHIGDIYVDASSGTFVLGSSMTIIGDTTINGVDYNSFETNALHLGNILITGQGRFNVQPLAEFEEFVIDTSQPVLLTGEYTNPVRVTSPNAQITLAEGMVFDQLILDEAALGVNIVVQSGVTGSDILYRGTAAIPNITYTSGATPFTQTAIAARVTNIDTNTDYSSIQAAIDAAGAHDTIEVIDGVYEEQITMNTAGLTLKAAASAQPIIRFASRLNSPVVMISASGILEGFVIDGLDSSSDSVAIDLQGTTGTLLSGLTLIHTQYGVRATGNNKPIDLAIRYSTFETEYGISDTANMLRLYVKDNTFNTSVEGIRLSLQVTIAQAENPFTNGLRRLVASDWKTWLEENNSGLTSSNGVVDDRTAATNVFQGSTIVNDVTFSSGVGFANFSLTYSLDGSGFITGSGKESLDAQVPGIGGFVGFGYGSVGIERPDTSVTHSSAVGFYNASVFNSSKLEVSPFGGVIGRYWYVYLARETAIGSDTWYPFRDGDVYFFTVTWYVEDVVHSQEHILVTMTTPIE